MNQQPPVEIRYRGGRIIIDTPYIRRLLCRGLRPIDYTMLALTADAHRMTVADLMRPGAGGAAVKATKLPVATYDSAVVYIAQHLFKPGRVLILQVCHDDWCKAIKTHRDRDCSPDCRPDFYAVEPPRGGLN
jgi:hypothetical protein